MEQNPIKVILRDIDVQSLEFHADEPIEDLRNYLGFTKAVEDEWSRGRCLAWMIQNSFIGVVQKDDPLGGISR